jgi:hypothetical protein
MAPLAYRDDKILARNLLSHPFFCLTPAEPFFRPDRSSTAPSCRVAVKDGRAFRGHPKGLSLTAASTMARWRSRSGRRPCVAAEHISSPRRSSRLPGSRSRSLYRSAGTPIGKSIDYLDFATIKLPAPAHASSRAACADAPSVQQVRPMLHQYCHLTEGPRRCSAEDIWRSSGDFTCSMPTTSRTNVW